MLRQLRLLLGISVFWLALSMLTDGVNTLVLPLQLSNLLGGAAQATALGLLTFAGLLAGALIQPFAGALSDRLRPVLARKGFIGLGLLLSLTALALFAALHNVPGVIAGYVGIQLSASIAQAGQQGLMPDLVNNNHRGLASGLKGFMDIAGATIGFVVLGHLLSTGNPTPALLAIAIALVIAYAVGILLTPEDHGHRSLSARTADTASPLLKSLTFDTHQHRAFLRLLLARFLFLLGIYATGRFLLYFVSDRLELPAGQAAVQAGNILALLALITVVASPVAGWLADRLGRLPLMIAGSALGALSALSLIFAHTEAQIVLLGGLMSIASASFSGGSWALLTDLVPKDESARFFGLANFSTAGSSALAGLLGPVLDAGQRVLPGSGYTVLFLLAGLAFLASAFPMRPALMKEVDDVRRNHRTEDQAGPDGSGLAVVSLPADLARPEEHQDTQAGTTPP